jgi:Polyketide cyclase / dehydrase and lipid transport.
VRVTDRDALASVEGIMPAPPSIVWERLTDPGERVRWQPGVVRVDQDLETGRRGVGTTTHCVHGEGATLEEILDWRPFEYYTLNNTVPGLGSFVSTTELIAIEEGTRMTVRFRKPRTAAERALYAAMGEEALVLYRRSMDSLAALLARETPAAEVPVAG